jgi:hypothetical protein
MRLVVAGALLLNIGTVVGCGFFYLDLFTCPDPDLEHFDSRGKPDPCHERDPDAGTDAAKADVANAGCPEACVPGESAPWGHFPLLTWIGLKGQAPPCPERAPDPDDTLYAGLVVPELSCDGCTCAPSAGSCEIPSGFKAHAAPLCAAQATETPFAAPSGWDGSCNKESPIDAGAMCGTPAVPCVQSISIDKLTIKTESCAAGTAPTPEQPYFELEAHTCKVGYRGVCDNGSLWCLPAPDPFPGGFRLCVSSIHDVTGESCPAAYPDGPYVFYKEGKLTDSRECDCTCGDPAGSKCTALVSVYEDDACTQTAFLSNMVDSSDPNPPCWNAPSGVAVGSKEITVPMYHLGTCEPKGEKRGDVDAGPPTTFCCTPEKLIP